MTPAGVAELGRRGHEVSVQHTAGDGSGCCTDDEALARGSEHRRWAMYIERAGEGYKFVDPVYALWFKREYVTTIFLKS